MRVSFWAVLAVFILSYVGPSCRGAAGQGSSRPLGEPVLEVPTLRSLGVYWVIQGDANQNAKVDVAYRRVGANEWRAGYPLFRVERGAHHPENGRSKVHVPDDAWLFAGSIVLLRPDTAYEIRLALSDPDGGAAERRLRSRTIAEPVAPPNAPQHHVIPGNGGGTGTANDPYRGLAAAQARAKPGDIFLLRAGVYEGVFTVERSGAPGKPIIWRGAGDGKAVLDGQGRAEKRPGRAVSAVEVTDVWFENLTIRNAEHAIVAHRSARLVIRRCHIHNVDYGVTFTNNDNDAVTGFFISDNLIEGPSTWPRTQGIESARGIQATGSGHVICYNRIRGFADAINTFPSQRCEAIDFHNNDISEMTDDGIEMDYSQRNTRCFHNRLTNVYHGISVQPVHGGPVYIFRNAMYNVAASPFKMHNSPSGALMFHNTSVRQGMPMVIATSARVRNCVFRNNLFLGAAANYAFESNAPMDQCDFDYDGFGGGPWLDFLKWNSQRYQTLAEVREKAPVYRRATFVDVAGALASGLQPPRDDTTQFDPAVVDLRLKAGTAAIDAGQVLPGFNDGFAGRAPDLGAYEFGAPLPHYGPRPKR